MAAETTAAAEHGHEGGIHIALAAERLGEFLGIPITNTLIATWAAVAVLILLAFVLRRKLTLIPGRLQLLTEMAVEYVYDFIERTLDNKEAARRFFPLIMTLFLFIFFANALEFLPGFGSVTVDVHGEPTALLRAANSDLNVTLALTIVAVLVIEFAGILTLGFFRYAGKFINFSSPVAFFVGIIELVGELARFVSFSFRLFGNIFAGKVLIGVTIFFVPYLLPVPVMAFELFVGFVQAAVFALLTLFFIKLAVMDPHENHA